MICLRLLCLQGNLSLCSEAPTQELPQHSAHLGGAHMDVQNILSSGEGRPYASSANLVKQSLPQPT